MVAAGREIICEADKAGDRACLRKSAEPHLIDLDTSKLLTRGNVRLRTQQNNGIEIFIAGSEDFAVCCCGRERQCYGMNILESAINVA